MILTRVVEAEVAAEAEAEAGSAILAAAAHATVLIEAVGMTANHGLEQEESPGLRMTLCLVVAQMKCRPWVRTTNCS